MYVSLHTFLDAKHKNKKKHENEIFTSDMYESIYHLLQKQKIS